MPNKCPKTLLAVAASLLVLGVLSGLVQAKPFSDGYNRKAYDDFVERILADFRKAGFVVTKGEVKDTPLREKEPVIETEVMVVKAPADFKKYFGELKLKNFFIQGEERQNGSLSIDIWVRYETGVNYNIFIYDNSFTADYEKEIGKAKQTLINYLFGYDCGTQSGGGFTLEIGSRFIFASASSASPLSLNKNKDFSKGMREFLSSFYRELKIFGFNFTLVENPPLSEIRVFGFPKFISMFLPEPETKLIAVKSRIIGVGEGVDIDVFNRSTKKFSSVYAISLFSGKPVKELAESAAKKIFYYFYTPDCFQYYGM